MSVARMHTDDERASATSLTAITEAAQRKETITLRDCQMGHAVRGRVKRCCLAYRSPWKDLHRVEVVSEYGEHQTSVIVCTRLA